MNLTIDTYQTLHEIMAKFLADEPKLATRIRTGFVAEATKRRLFHRVDEAERAFACVVKRMKAEGDLSETFQNKRTYYAKGVQ